MKKIIIFLVLIACINFIYCGEDKKDENVFNKYKEILYYGVDKEVLDILDDIGKSPREDFFPLILARYKESNLSETKIALVSYFAECETINKEILDYLYEETINEPQDLKLHSTLLSFLGKKGKLREGLLLLKRLDYENNLIQLTAADSLSRIDDRELIKPILVRLELSDVSDDKYLSGDIKSRIILYFGRIKAVEAIEYLRKILKEYGNDDYLIMYTMVSLSQIGDEGSIDLIEKKLASENAKIKEYAAYSISQYKNKKVFPVLKRMLKDNREKVRIFACQGIVLNQDFDSINILMYKFKNDPSDMVKKEAFVSLIYLEPNGINEIKNFIKDKKYDESQLYVISEAVMKKTTAFNVDYLNKIFDDTDKKGKDIIAKNVVKGDSNLLDPIIKKLLSSEDHLVRMGAIRAVYNIKNSTLWPDVKNISENDPVEAVRNIAKKYLSLKK